MAESASVPSTAPLLTNEAPKSEEILGPKTKRKRKIKVKSDRPPRPPRALTAYNLFVKTHYPEVKNLDSKERYSALAKMWQASKSTSVKS